MTAACSSTGRIPSISTTCTSGRIAVFFDDLETPLMEAIDKTFTSGRVGIGSFDDMNNFTAVKVSGRKAEAGK